MKKNNVMYCVLVACALLLSACNNTSNSHSSDSSYSGPDAATLPSESVQERSVQIAPVNVSRLIEGLSLSWPAVENAASYEVFVSNASYDETLVTDSASISLNNLENVSYSVTINALDFSGDTFLSSAIIIATPLIPLETRRLDTAP